MSEAAKASPFVINVYHRVKERTRWDETDSEDSFRIEPTNVGAYYERQNKLHEELQTRFSRQGARSPNLTSSSSIVIKTAEETKRMIEELRAKHLQTRRENIAKDTTPASPESSVAAVDSYTQD